MTDRAAVVIGVDKTGGLDPLEAAAKSAVEVAAWFQGEGYDVELITDQSGEAHAEDVRKALEQIVTKPPTYRLLVVYFSGHGYWHARSDRWLFSGAPTNSADAINLDSAIDIARNSGIETVVFVSDACRSIPGAEGQRVEGIDALPNVIFDTPSKVDYFKATAQATAAYEAKIPVAAGGTGERESVLTKALRLAYAEATPEMISTVTVNGNTVTVVPNRKLEDYLQDKVDELLGVAAPGLQQTLDINVPSRDDVYMATAAAGVGVAPSPPPSATPDIGLVVASAAFEAYTGGTSMVPLADAASEDAVARLMPRHGVKDSFETECGFLIWGAAISGAAASNGAGAEVDTGGNGDDVPGIIRMHINEPGASVAVQLEDGRSFVVAALRGYIGHVTLDEEGVTNVSYVPSQSNYRSGGYESRRDEIDRLRALVTVAVDRGRFRVTDDDAWKLADAIRVEKAYDPSLGLYAAHAYSAAGLDTKVEDVLHFMWDDLETALFDVVLLASRRVDPDAWPVVPFCPMLTQSWNLLRPRGFSMPDIVDDLRPHLRNSLWTTFGADAQDVLVQAIENGDLT